MKTLITGGAGYIGSHTAVEMLNSGNDIVIIDNFYNSCQTALDRIKELTGKDFPFEQCDIRDRAALDAVFEKYDIPIISISIRSPSLEDIFIYLTGKGIDGDTNGNAAHGGKAA